MVNTLSNISKTIQNFSLLDIEKNFLSFVETLLDYVYFCTLVDDLLEI